MVLVDPSFPNQERVIAETSPINARTIGELTRQHISDLQTCAAKLKNEDSKPGDANFDDCLDGDGDVYPA